MNVKLVSLTKSILEEKDFSPEELIVYIARVSNPSNQLNSETSEKHITYLVKHNHWSPFEMVDMTVEIVTSRAIAQQILRHRSFSFQEFSQRYAVATHFEPVQYRKQALKNRQSSSEEFDPKVPIKMFDGTVMNFSATEVIGRFIEEAEEIYKALIQAGVAKECARMILPLTTQTKLYMKGSIRSWIHYLQIRTDESTQIEHRQIADSILSIFNQQFPVISKALTLKRK
ncbi:MAG: FAD-dependent thymidylate synthase [Bacteroidota bacterium]|nr:FAD-dependent thymidylate synthase [Bacteroidota bacterium]